MHRFWKNVGHFCLKFFRELLDENPMSTEESQCPGSEEVSEQGEEQKEVSPGEEKGREVAAAADAAEEKLRDAYLRLQADFENFKKRAAREREEWIRTSTRDLIGELLTIVDHLDLALQSARPDDAKGQQILQGFALIVGQFKKLLAQQGLAEVGQVGELFDPRSHEAVGQSPHPTVPVDHVCQIVRTGYRLRELILRPASVLLSSGPAPEEREVPAGAKGEAAS